VMKKFLIAGLLLALCFALPVTAQSPSAPTPKPQNPFEAVREFSATMHGGIIGPQSDGKIYRSGDLMRVDGPVEYMVTNLRTKETFTVLYKTGYCMTGSVPAARTYPFFVTRNATVIQVDRGEETVDNHPTRIEEVTITREGGPDLKLLLWEAKDLQGFPIKMRRAATSIVGSKDRQVRFTDVQLGPPDASLFVEPKDCGEAPQPPGSSTAIPPRPASAPPAKSSTPQK
jgi:hypothetical protein